MKRKIQVKAERRVRGIRFVPSLLLAGLWLEKAGFEIGSEVNITVADGKIIISI